MKILISEQQLQNMKRDFFGLIKPLEKALNRVMSKKYPWWMEIEIISIYVHKRNTLFESILKVPEEWGEKKWEEFNYDKYFPKNDAWELDNPYEKDYVSLSEIVSTYDGDKIREDITEIWTFLSGEFDAYISLSPIMLKFV